MKNNFKKFQDFIFQLSNEDLVYLLYKKHLLERKTPPLKKTI